MIKFFKSLYFDQRFYLFVSGITAFFLLSFWFSVLFEIAILIALISGIFLITDFLLLFGSGQGVAAKRKVAEKLSNGDQNTIVLILQNNLPFKIYVTIIDEVPFQFQKRDFSEKITLEMEEQKTMNYTLRPLSRGEYHFGNLNIFVASPLRMTIKRFLFDNNKVTPVYPSYMQMKKYEFMAMSNNLKVFGMKRIRKVGHTMEFEQIRKYVEGDDVRILNWKATAKKGTFMVNQYQDEKSQPIYSLIDIGRAMKMPFDGLSLLDYAINSALAFSNIALDKNDKVGMLTFSKKVECHVTPSNKKVNLATINEALYRIYTDYSDTDYGLLYATIKRKITQRSLLILYTNFEHITGVKRQLPYLKLIAKQHVLITIFFKNTELNSLVDQDIQNLQELYVKTIADKLSYEKKLIVKELENYAKMKKVDSIILNARDHAIKFYEKSGYEVVGLYEGSDTGIPHSRMTKKI